MRFPVATTTKLLTVSKSRLAGQSFVELCVGLICLIPIILVLIDLAIIVIAQQLNDTLCRDAARIAAGGAPELIATRAQRVLDEGFKGGEGYITSITLVSAAANIPAGGDPGITSIYGGPIQGTVSVETDMLVKIPASVPPLPQTVNLHSKNVFPITFNRPNTSL